MEAQLCLDQDVAVVGLPEFVTAIGLVKYGSFFMSRPGPRSFLAAGLTSTITSFFRRS